MSLLPPQHVINEMMKHCRCCQCCQSPPCDGVMAGGLCDQMNCVHEDELDEPEYHDEEDSQ